MMILILGQLLYHYFLFSREVRSCSISLMIFYVHVFALS